MNYYLEELNKRYDFGPTKVSYFILDIEGPDRSNFYYSLNRPPFISLRVLIFIVLRDLFREKIIFTEYSDYKILVLHSSGLDEEEIRVQWEDKLNSLFPEITFRLHKKK